MKITLDLDKQDALAVLAAIEDAALSWRMQAAISTGEERQYADYRARVYRSQADRIIDRLYPDGLDRPMVAA